MIRSAVVVYPSTVIRTARFARSGAGSLIYSGPDTINVLVTVFVSFNSLDSIGNPTADREYEFNIYNGSPPLENTSFSTRCSNSTVFSNGIINNNTVIYSGVIELQYNDIISPSMRNLNYTSGTFSVQITNYRITVEELL